MGGKGGKILNPKVTRGGKHGGRGDSAGFLWGCKKILRRMRGKQQNVDCCVLNLGYHRGGERLVGS